MTDDNLDDAGDSDYGSEVSDFEPEFEPVRKRRRTAPSVPTARSTVPDSEESPLYRALSQADASPQALAAEWCENYLQDQESGSSDAFAGLFNLWLRCCGCTSLVQPHDVSNVEAAPSTTSEVALAFEKQKFHEFPYLSNNKSIRFFRKNVQDFTEHTVLYAHEKGFLYSDTTDASPFMTQLVTWLATLSSCTVRPLRHVATDLMLTVQTQLCHNMAAITASLERQQRQLATAKRGRNSAAKVRLLTELISSYHTKKQATTNYFDDITDTVFVHRYRDLDAGIRQCCLVRLCEWMLVCPSHFLQSSYMRYYGWMMSDPSEHVRAEVVRSLLKLYRNTGRAMNASFRQFTDRFKAQMINMAWKDSFAVSLNLAGVLRELHKLGFLLEEDVVTVLRNTFRIKGKGRDRLLVEFAKVLELYNEAYVDAQIERYSQFFEEYDSPQFGDEPEKLSLESCLKAKNIVRVFQSASDLDDDVDVVPVFVALSSLPSYSLLWDFLIRYLLYDLSAISFIPRNSDISENNDEVLDFMRLLELTGNDQSFLLKFIQGGVAALCGRKKRLSEQEESDLSQAMVQLANHLPSLANFASKKGQMHLLLHIWNSALGAPLGSGNLHSIFVSLGQAEIYNDITGLFLNQYRDLDRVQKAEMDAYDVFFEKLLPEFQDLGNSSGPSVMNSELRLKVQTLLQELVAEAVGELSSDAEGNDQLQTQRHICDVVVRSSHAIAKINRLANFVNINEYVADNVHSLTVSLIDLLVQKVFTKFSIYPLVDLWPNNFVKIVDDVGDGFAAVMDLVLVSACWRLDRLIYENTEKPDHINDIELIFEDVSTIVIQVVHYIKSFSLVNHDNKVLSRKLVALYTTFATGLIDVVVSLKIFYVKFRDNNNFLNFNAYFLDSEGMGRFVAQPMEEELQTQLQNIFLHKETRLAVLSGVSLERQGDEDVNLEELYREVPVTRAESNFDSDNESDEEPEPQDKDTRVWEAEKELCVFTVKLFTLINTGIADKLRERVKLNSEKIGGLFHTIVKQNEPKPAPLVETDRPAPLRDDSPATNATDVSDLQIDITDKEISATLAEPGVA